MKPYGLILLDLFWTTVDLDPERTRVDMAQGAHLLFEEVAREFPHLEEAHFVETFAAARREVFKTWEEGALEEVSSVEKFRRLLQALGLQGEAGALDRLAARLTAQHMERVIGCTVIPEPRKHLLQRLSAKFPLVLVSNFDHSPAGYEILRRHGLADFFERIIISDDLGKRKPHRLLFEEAMKGYPVAPQDTLMVGDTAHADIAGAQALGLSTAWIQRPDVVWPEGITKPEHVLQDLQDIVRIPRVYVNLAIDRHGAQN